MDIKKYSGCFHDGVVYNMQHKNNEIILSLESAELRPEWNKDKIKLSKERTITGYLHLQGVKSVSINTNIFPKRLKMIYDIGEIYDLEISEQSVVLVASWSNDAPKLPEETDVFIYKIEAEKIYWENVPTAYDALWDALDQKTD